MTKFEIFKKMEKQREYIEKNRELAEKLLNSFQKSGKTICEYCKEYNEKDYKSKYNPLYLSCIIENLLGNKNEEDMIIYLNMHNKSKSEEMYKILTTKEKNMTKLEMIRGNNSLYESITTLCLYFRIKEEEAIKMLVNKAKELSDDPKFLQKKKIEDDRRKYIEGFYKTSMTFEEYIASNNDIFRIEDALEFFAELPAKDSITYKEIMRHSYLNKYSNIIDIMDWATTIFVEIGSSRKHFLDYLNKTNISVTEMANIANCFENKFLSNKIRLGVLKINLGLVKQNQRRIENLEKELINSHLKDVTNHADIMEIMTSSNLISCTEVEYLRISIRGEKILKNYKKNLIEKHVVEEKVKNNKKQKTKENYGQEK